MFSALSTGFMGDMRRYMSSGGFTESGYTPQREVEPKQEASTKVANVDTRPAVITGEIFVADTPPGAWGHRYAA